jgi:hypothetical protein
VSSRSAASTNCFGPEAGPAPRPPRAGFKRHDFGNAHVEFYAVSGDIYLRQAGASSCLSVLFPWQAAVGEPTELPFVAENGEYLFKFGRTALPGGFFAVYAESPEDGRRYYLDVIEVRNE